MFTITVSTVQSSSCPWTPYSSVTGATTSHQVSTSTPLARPPVRIGRLCPLRASRIHDPSLLPATLPLTQAAHASCLAFHLFLVGAGLIVSGPGYRSFWAQRSRLCPPAASMPMPWPPPALRARRCSAHRAPCCGGSLSRPRVQSQPSLPGVLLRRLSFPDPCSSSTFFTLLAPAHSSRFN